MHVAQKEGSTDICRAPTNDVGYSSSTLDGLALEFIMIRVLGIIPGDVAFNGMTEHEWWEYEREQHFFVDGDMLPFSQSGNRLDTKNSI